MRRDVQENADDFYKDLMQGGELQTDLEIWTELKIGKQRN